mmetsp:Transcript_43281/g.142093  ORF Transcript_43281/g.142093 Transcript_43281/m.142093 type:complete len:225 (-) Transcript_43281:541-1215(-)
METASQSPSSQQPSGVSATETGLAASPRSSSRAAMTSPPSSRSKTSNTYRVKTRRANQKEARSGGYRRLCFPQTRASAIWTWTSRCPQGPVPAQTSKATALIRIWLKEIWRITSAATRPSPPFPTTGTLSIEPRCTLPGRSTRSALRPAPPTDSTSLVSSLSTCRSTTSAKTVGLSARHPCATSRRVASSSASPQEIRRHLLQLQFLVTNSQPLEALPRTLSRS